MAGTTPFEQFMADVNCPMVIVTTVADGERAGCLVGFCTQTSIAPSRFLVCLSRENQTTRVAGRARHLAVHLVSAHAESLARLFGGVTGDDADKFAQAAWTPGPNGVPLLTGCPTRFVGEILDRLDLGDHLGFLLAPQEARADPGAPPMRMAAVVDLTAGHPT